MARKWQEAKETEAGAREERWRTRRPQAKGEWEVVFSVCTGELMSFRKMEGTVSSNRILNLPLFQPNEHVQCVCVCVCTHSWVHGKRACVFAQAEPAHTHTLTHSHTHTHTHTHTHHTVVVVVVVTGTRHNTLKPISITPHICRDTRSNAASA